MNRLPDTAPDAILFDLDNTLCTFIEAKRAACRAVVHHLGCGSEDDLFAYFLRQTHGFEDPLHIHDYLFDLGIFTKNLADETTMLFEETKITHITPYPGVVSVIEKIHATGIPMAIVTDASTIQAKKRIEKCRLAPYFPVLVTPDISGTRKPNHTQFITAIHQLHIKPSNIWLVGDSIRREVIPGNELGYTTVYARYGDWIGGTELEDPVYAIDQFSELLSLLRLSV